MGRQVQFLLDTHALLWAVGAPSKLGQAAAALRDPDALILVSPVSAMEIATKHRKGDFPDGAKLVAGWEQILTDYRLTELPLRSVHALRAGAYAQPHKDPFDRLLAAQSEVEQAPLITRDAELRLFPCRTLW
jgi:PIN domain nuclease of toxin-antitoxin system